jgi:hypothetical protein
MAKQLDKTKIHDNDTIEECFIITPIGALGSETFKKAMGLIDAVIDPVLAERGMKALPANRMQDLGSINKQLIKRVIEDRLVIANLTDLNPNVMYELAIRHGARKPVIIMAEEGTRLPFDITDQRTIFYSDTLSGVEIAKAELRKKIDFALLDELPDNPIYSYLENAKLFKEIGEADINKALLNKLNSIEDRLSVNSSARSNNVGFNTGRGKSKLFTYEDGYRYVTITLNDDSNEGAIDTARTKIDGIVRSIFGNSVLISYNVNKITFETPSDTPSNSLTELENLINSLAGVQKVTLSPF